MQIQVTRLLLFLVPCGASLLSHCWHSLLVLKSTSYSLLAKALGDNSDSRQSLKFYNAYTALWIPAAARRTRRLRNVGTKSSKIWTWILFKSDSLLDPREFSKSNVRGVLKLLAYFIDGYSCDECDFKCLPSVCFKWTAEVYLQYLSQNIQPEIERKKI